MSVRITAIAPDESHALAAAAIAAATAAGQRSPESQEQVRAQLEAFCRLLATRNAVTNLTGARTPVAIADHIRDSLLLEPYLRGPFVDVGSGGGFPAVPLTIATGLPGTLLESVVKKARFLEEVVVALGLPLEVRAERAETAGRNPTLRGTFASATARAVGPLSTVLELTLPLLAVGGVAILQRGRLGEAERSAGSAAALVLGGVFEDEVSTEAQPGDERRILFVRKVQETGPRFPRRAGVAAKRPLGGFGEPAARRD